MMEATMFELRLFGLFFGIGAFLGACYGIVRVLTCDMPWDEP